MGVEKIGDVEKRINGGCGSTCNNCRAAIVCEKFGQKVEVIVTQTIGSSICGAATFFGSNGWRKQKRSK